MPAELDFSQFMPPPPKVAGQLMPGNIDLHKRPVVHNPDGSISTVRSMSANFDGREVLIPTVAADGSGILDNDAAIQQYRKTGQHLGMFDTPDNANAYAESLHNDQAAEYAPQGGPKELDFSAFMPKPVAPVSQVAQAIAEPAKPASMGMMAMESSIPTLGGGGGTVWDSGATQEENPGLAAAFDGPLEQNPRVLAAQGLQRGEWGDEAKIFGMRAKDAWYKTLLGSSVDASESGADAANQAARLREAALGTAPESGAQQRARLLDPSFSANYKGPEDTRLDRAGALDAEAARRNEIFQKTRVVDRAATEAIPSFLTAPGVTGKVLAGTNSALSDVFGGLGSFETLAPIGKAKTAFEALKAGALSGGVTGLLTDPLVQQNEIAAGLQQNYDPVQTGFATVAGAAGGGALNTAFHGLGNLKAWIKERSGRNLESMSQAEQSQWLKDAEEASRRAGEDMADPAFHAEQVQQNTGLDQMAPDLPPNVRAAQQAQQHSELVQAFADPNVWPRDQVQIGPEGVDIPEGTHPVRNVLGEQARQETHAPINEAVQVLQTLGQEQTPENVSRLASIFADPEGPTVAQYLDSVQQYDTARSNSQRMAATAQERQGRQMTPPLQRDVVERQRIDENARKAFTIKEMREKRAEADIAAGREQQPDYTAGATTAGDEQSARMRQDVFARSAAPPEVTTGPESGRGIVGSTMQGPRRSVDRFGTKQAVPFEPEPPAAPQPPPEYIPREEQTMDANMADDLQRQREGNLYEGESTPYTEPPAPVEPTPAIAGGPPPGRIEQTPDMAVNAQGEAVRGVPQPVQTPRPGSVRARALKEFQDRGGQGISSDQLDALEGMIGNGFTPKGAVNRLLREYPDLGGTEHAPTKPAAKPAPAPAPAPTDAGNRGPRGYFGERPEGKPEGNLASVSEWAAYEKHLEANAEPEVKARLADLDKRMKEEYSAYYTLGGHGKEGYGKPSPTQADQLQAQRHKVEWSRLGQERQRLLRGEADMNPLAKQSHADYEAKLAESEKSHVAVQPYLDVEGRLPKANRARFLADQLNEKLKGDLSDADRAKYEKERDYQEQDFQRETTKAKGETAAPPPKAKPKAEPAPEPKPEINQERLDHLESVVRLAKEFDDTPETIAKAEQELADYKAGKHPDQNYKAPGKAPEPGTMDQHTADLLKSRIKDERVIEKGGKLLRDENGNVTSRTQQLETDRDIRRLLSKENGYGYSAAEAANILDRAVSGKGRKLTDKQKKFVDDLRQAQHGPDAPPEGYALETHSEADLTAKKQAADDAQAKAAKTKKAAEDKAQADKDRGDFKLSGSDRPADVAASHGQDSLFGPGQLNDVTGLIKAPFKIAKDWLFDKPEHDASAMENIKELWNDLRPAGNDSGQGKTFKRKAIDVAKKVAYPITRPIEKIAFTAEGRLRDIGKRTNSKIVQQMADNYHAEAGRGSSTKATETERMEQQLFTQQPGQPKSRMGQVADIQKLLLDAKRNTPGFDINQVGKQVRSYVENPRLPRKGVAGEVAGKMEALFKDLLAYQKEAGIDLGDVKNYFPRVMDEILVGKNRGKFLTAAEKAYKQDNPGASKEDITAMAQSYLDRVINGEQAAPGTASSLGKANFLKGRTFSDAAAKHLQDFQVTDPNQLLSSYVPAAVKRAEQAKSGITVDGKHLPFGENFKNWDAVKEAIRKESPQAFENLDEITRLVTTMTGADVSKLSPTSKKLLATAQNVVTMSMLEKSVNATATEMFTGPMRAITGRPGHDALMLAGTAGQHGVNLVRKLWPEALGGGRSDKLQGIMDNATSFGTVHPEGMGSVSSNRFGGGDPVGKWNHKMINKFFQHNLMEPVTSYQRAITTHIGQRFLRDITSGIPGGDVFIRELGVEKGQEAAFAKYVQSFGKEHPNAGQLSGPMGEAYRTAVMRFVDQAVQRPTAAVKPRWHSTPAGKLVGAFQGMNTAVVKNIHQRWGRLLLNKEIPLSTRIKMGGAMSVNVAAIAGLQAGVLEMMDKLYDRADSRELTKSAKAERVASRIGLFGPLDQYAQALGSVRYASSPSQALAGAGPGSAMRLMDQFAQLYGPNNSDKNDNMERKVWRQAYQLLAEPALQAGLTMFPQGKLASAAAMYAIPKSGEWAVDKVFGPAPPPSKKNHGLEPIKGLYESAFGPKDEVKAKDDGRPKRPERPVRDVAQRPVRPTRPLP